MSNLLYNKIVWSLLFVLILGLGWWAVSKQPPTTNQDSQIPLLGSVPVVVYKTPTCGCCEVYIQYLKGLGVSVTTRTVNDLDAVKREFNIPAGLESCHTSLVAGYTVEGHVPAEAIEKLLREKPTVSGIALPGMPSGTPGMPGPKTEPWVIYSFTADGQTLPFITI